MKGCKDVDRYKMTLDREVMCRNGAKVSGSIKFAENLGELVVRFYAYDGLQ